MSTKKVLPRLVAEKFFVSISSPLFADGSRLLERFFSGLLFRSLGSFLSSDNVRRLLKTWQAIRFRGNHGSIRGSGPIAISGSPRGHSVENSDSVPKHTGSDHLSDTPLEPSVSRTETDHHPRGWNELSTRDAQAACRCNSLASKHTPFFQIVNVIAAIFRARVRRAIAGLLPFARSPA
jgi:hypothetical protein